MTSGRQSRAKRQAALLDTKFLAASSPSHHRKLARAEGHITDVDKLITTWMRGGGYKTFEKLESTGRSVLYAAQLKPLPDDLALIIGDALQGLRNSLDHLIFALSQKYTPGMGSEKEWIPAFPVAREVGDEVQVKHNALSLMDPALRPKVCELAAAKPLVLLNKMSNRDKHREVLVSPVAESGMTSYTLHRSDGRDDFESLGASRLSVGEPPAPLVKFVRSPGVKATVTHGVQVLFDQGTEVANQEVVPTLRGFTDHVRDTVFRVLDPHL